MRIFLESEDISAGAHNVTGVFEGKLSFKVGVRVGFRFRVRGWLGWLRLG